MLHTAMGQLQDGHLGHLGHQSKFYSVPDVVLTNNPNLGCHFGCAFPPKHQHPCFVQHLVNFGSYLTSLFLSLLLGIQVHRCLELYFTRAVTCRGRVDPCRTQVASSTRFVCHICSVRLGYVLQRGLLLCHLRRHRN